MITDKGTRSKAMPFEALPFNGGARRRFSVNDDSDILRLSAVDSTKLITSNLYTVRLTIPEKGDLTELYLTTSITAAVASGFNLRVTIGRFSSTDTLAPETSYSEEYIQSGHRLLTGTDDKYSVAANGRLDIFELNLLPGIPSPTSSSFSRDGFVLLLAFDSIPDQGTGWELNSFKVVGSTQIGLGT